MNLELKFLFSNSILFILLVFFSFFYILDYSWDISNYQYSCIFVFVLFVIYILRWVNNVNPVNLYSLFFLTTILFLGGRFVAVFLGYEDKDLFRMDYFTVTSLNEFQKTEFFSLLMLSYVCLEIGMYFSYFFFKKNELTNFDLTFDSRYLYGLFLLVIFALVYNLYDVFLTVLSSGYASLYANQVGSYKGSDLYKTFFALVVGLVLLQNNKSLKNKMLIVYLLYALVFLVMGARGVFITFALYLVWLKSEYGTKKINMLLVTSISMFLIFFLNFVYSAFTLRDDLITGGGPYDSFLRVIYEQGISLFVFYESMQIPDYPLPAFFQSFIPGVGKFLSLFYQIDFADVSFSSYLSKSLDKGLFYDGYGLGWTLFSDLFVMSGRMFGFYIFFIMFFAFCLSALENLSRKNLYVRMLLLTTIPAILFLPRSGLYSVVPLMYYAFAFLMISLFFIKKKQNSYNS